MSLNIPVSIVSLRSVRATSSAEGPVTIKARRPPVGRDPASAGTSLSCPHLCAGLSLWTSCVRGGGLSDTKLIGGDGVRQMEEVTRGKKKMQGKHIKDGEVVHSRRTAPQLLCKITRLGVTPMATSRFSDWWVCGWVTSVSGGPKCEHMCVWQTN